MDVRMGRKDFLRLGGARIRQSLVDWLSILDASDAPPIPLESHPDGVSAAPGVGVPRGLRPPGALPEARFVEACTRCRLCVEACPHEALALAGSEDGYPAGTPFMPNVAAKPCHLCEAMPCVAACADGALVAMPHEDLRMGLAEVDPAICFAYQGQICDYCIDRCPFPEEAIFSDDRGRPVVNPDLCVGCGMCAYICVTTPGAIAIHARPAPEQALPDPFP